MATHITETITCDICKKECEPVKKIRLIGTEKGGDDITLDIYKIEYCEEYVTQGNGDVCQECLIKYMKKWISRNEEKTAAELRTMPRVPRAKKPSV